MALLTLLVMLMLAPMAIVWAIKKEVRYLKEFKR